MIEIWKRSVKRNSLNFVKKIVINVSTVLVISFVRKHYIPEGGQNISTAKCDTNLRAIYIYPFRKQNCGKQNLGVQTV